MTPRALRLIRGWVAAFVATTLAVLAHVAAGGQWPSVMLYALCVALAAPVCMVLAGMGTRATDAGFAQQRDRAGRSRAAVSPEHSVGRGTGGRVRLTGLPGVLGLGLAVVGSQTLFHVLLSMTGGYVTAADHTGHAAHAVAPESLSAAPQLVLAPVSSASGHAAHMVHAGDAATAAHGVLADGQTMLFLHVMAAAVAFVVLRYGELGVLNAVATLLVRAVRLAVAVAMPWVSLRPWQPGYLQPLPARVLIWARGALQYRGPPQNAVLA